MFVYYKENRTQKVRANAPSPEALQGFHDKPSHYDSGLMFTADITHIEFTADIKHEGEGGGGGGRTRLSKTPRRSKAKRTACVMGESISRF